VALLGIGAIGACFGPSLSFLVPGIAARFGAGAGGTGALATAYGIGAILGATAIVRTGDRIPRATATRLGYMGFGVGELAAVSTRSLAVGLVAFVVAGVGYSLWLTSIGTAFQVQITDAFRGRLTGFYIAAVVGGTPVGAVLGGWLGDRVGLGPVFVAYGAILLLLATLGARRLRFGLLDRATPLPD
jgi:predicted MFS family arabinose efflux permease